MSSASGTYTRRRTEGRLPWARALVVSALPAWLGGLEYQALPWREVLAAEVVIVPASARCVSNMLVPLVLLCQRLQGKPVLTWGHDVNFPPDAMARLMPALRNRLLGLPQGHLVYTQTCAAALWAVGFDPSPCCCIPQVA